MTPRHLSDPAKVSADIRARLKAAGVNLSTVSVKTRNWLIVVRSLSLSTDAKLVRECALDAYYRKPHGWLVVMVDGESLPMPDAKMVAERAERAAVKS